MADKSPRSYDLPLDTSALFADFYHDKRRKRSSSQLQPARPPRRTSLSLLAEAGIETRQIAG